MPKADRLKEEIGWLKMFFTVLLAVEFSVMAWLAQNYRRTETLLIWAAVASIIGLMAALVMIHRRAYNRLDQLEKQ